MRLLAVAFGFVVLVAALVWNQYREDGRERARAAVAGEIAGRPVKVRCQGFPSELLDIGWTAGEVDFAADGRPTDKTRLKRGVCGDLDRFRGNPATSDPDARYAVHILAHEAWHLRGVVDEATTECYALQSTALVAGRLGASPGEARALAVWNLLEAYPLLPASYRRGDCRDGGPFDLRPDSAVWP